MSRAQRYLEWGLLAIVAVMPFHAFLSVWLGHIFGHQALWQSWKEVLILVLGSLVAWMAWNNPKLRQKLNQPWNLAILGFAAIALVVTLVMQPALRTALFGIKTDFEFLLIFVIAQVAASRPLKLKMVKALLVSSAVVIGFGLLQISILPRDFLTHFGYGPTTVTPYQILDPAVGSVRILSTLGGPNQLGSFLILPLALVFAFLLRRPRWWHIPFLSAGLLVEWHTYSRSGLLGLATAFIFVGIASLPAKLRLPSVLALTVLAALFFNLVFASVGSNKNLQYYLFHGSTRQTGLGNSTDQHAQSNKLGIDIAREHPIGEGLGAAGPASFHGTTPQIPESYYLQLAIETGIAGLIAFLLCQVLVGIRLAKLSPGVASAAPLVGALAGISVYNLFLHGWADSSTALVFWAYAGVVLGAELEKANKVERANREYENN